MSKEEFGVPWRLAEFRCIWKERVYTERISAMIRADMAYEKRKETFDVYVGNGRTQSLDKGKWI